MPRQRCQHPLAHLGFTLIELALVLVILGIILVPLARTLETAQQNKNTTTTENTLEQAKEALLAYAAQHNGCLPHAADLEGGLPDSDALGNTQTYVDTGTLRQAAEPFGGGAGQRAGDVPWADLSLAGRGLAGNNLRLQYYVASPYTSASQTRAGVADNPATRRACPARLRQAAEVWQATTRYALGDVVLFDGLYYVASITPAMGTLPTTISSWAQFGSSGQLPAYVPTTAYTTGAYVTDGGVTYRALGDSTGAAPASNPSIWRPVGLPWQIAGVPDWQSHATQGYRRGELVRHNGRIFRAIAAITTPSTAAPVASATGPNWQDISLPAFISGTPKLLEARLGPTINAAPGNTVASAYTIAVLLAPSRAENPQLGRFFTRAPTHQTCTSATACTNWVTLSDANVDSRSFSLTAAAINNPAEREQLITITYADYASYLVKQGLTAQPIHY